MSGDAHLALTVSTKFEVDTTIRCLVIALLPLIRYVTLWPWPLTIWLWSVVIHGGSRGQPLHQVWRSYAMVPSAAAWGYLQPTRSIPSLSGVMGVRSTFLSLVTLTFDIWPWHSNSSERGTKPACLWIWSKSVQRFPRYLIRKQKQTNKQKVTDSAKTEPFLRAVMSLCR